MGLASECLTSGHSHSAMTFFARKCKGHPIFINSFCVQFTNLAYIITNIRRNHYV